MPDYKVDIVIHKVDNVNLFIECDFGIAQELSDFFAFKAENFYFHPKYRAKLWDGNIRLFNLNSRLLYFGLKDILLKFCETNNYSYLKLFEDYENEFSLLEAEDFIETLNLPFPFRDYQLKSFVQCIRNKRNLVLSPTGSGKSLIIYSLVRYLNLKTLVIVPTVNLTRQMFDEFGTYSKNIDWDKKDYIQIISEGKTKDLNYDIVISTWQSIYKLPKVWFNEFECIIVDEAHIVAKAKSITSILEKNENAICRYGFTGTLKPKAVNKLVLIGLFGNIIKNSSTKDLIEQGHLAKFEIKSILLRHKENIKGFSYHDEINFLCKSNKRNSFITNLALSLTGNTLILFTLVKNHGIPFFELLKLKNKKGITISLVHGEIAAETREEIRKNTANETNSIICASYGTFQLGVNIPNIHNIIFASPSKSQIRVFQSIGRGLRKHPSKTITTLYDIADDFCIDRYKNYTFKHYLDRQKMYKTEEFPTRIYNVKLK